MAYSANPSEYPYRESGLVLSPFPDVPWLVRGNAPVTRS